MELSERLVEIKNMKVTDGGDIEFDGVIRRETTIRMFNQYDFQKSVERMIADRIAREIPIEKLNDIYQMLDLESIAKAVSLDLINQVKGARNSY